MNKTTYYTSFIFSIILGLLGFAILFNPVKTVVIITILLSIIMIVSGIANLSVFFSLKTVSSSYFFLIEGIISIVLGLIVLMNENARENLLPLLIAFWIILKSITAIVTSTTLKRIGNSAWLYLFSWGIIGIIIGFLITAFPQIMQFYISFIIGGIVVIISGFLIVSLIRLRKNLYF